MMNDEIERLRLEIVALFHTDDNIDLPELPEKLITLKESCCDRCGWFKQEYRQCRVICPNCHAQLDCSDLFKD